MEALFRFVSGVVAGVAALFAPIHPLVITTLLFIGVDFVSAGALTHSVKAADISLDIQVSK